MTFALEIEPHEHRFGPFHWSAFGGSYHRDCLEPGCRVVSLDADDLDDETDDDEPARS